MTPPRRLRKPFASSVAALAVAGCMTWAWAANRPAASAQPAPAAPAHRGHEAVTAEIQPQIDQMLSLFGQGKIDDMLHRMPLPSGATRDQFEGQRQQLVSLYGSAGRYSGFDVVGFQSLTPRYCEVYALAYFEKEPALFQFGFYRPGNEWQVQTFRVRTDLAQFLDLLPVQRP